MGRVELFYIVVTYGTFPDFLWSAHKIDNYEDAEKLQAFAKERGFSDAKIEPCKLWRARQEERWGNAKAIAEANREESASQADSIGPGP